MIDKLKGMIELDDDRAADLDSKTQILIDHTGEQPEIEIEYFIPDKRKSGGATSFKSEL